MERFPKVTHRRRRGGFSMTELLTVVGLIALLTSLLLPVLGKVRAAAGSAACAANLRQMGLAWVTYTTESRGRLIEYAWNSPATPEASWNAYWPGVLDGQGVRGPSLLCPAAADASPDATRRGYGTASSAWTGRFMSAGTTVRLNATTYRDGSYGFNRYLTAGSVFGPDPSVPTTHVTAARSLTDVPVFFDSVFYDAQPANGSDAAPVKAPPNLRGDQVTAASAEHWRFLLARHGRGVNVAFADGSTRWVILEDTYAMEWKVGWVMYRLRLPAR